MATVTRAKRATKEPPREYLAPDEIRPEPRPFPGYTCMDCGEQITWNQKIDGKGLCRRCDPEACYDGPDDPAEANGQPAEPLPSLADAYRASCEAVLSTSTPAGIAAFDPEATPANGTAPAGDGPKEPFRFTTAIASLGRNRFNPRENFEEEELEKLADSLRRHGQLQPVVVRKTEPGSPVKPLISTEPGHTRATHEIVAGERRVLAALKLGWTRISVEEIDCDDARACELAIAENRDRKDISQVEYARGLQKLADLKGLDPAGLAADQGLSEQHVRNLLRLLKTPAEWQQLVIEGKLDGTHLRTAAPFLHVPAIAKDLAKDLARRGEEKPSLDEWSRHIRNCAWHHGQRIERHVHTSNFGKSGTVTIKPTHPKWSDLDVADVDGEKFALNAKLCKKLLDEEEAAWKKKQTAATSGKKGKGSKQPVDLAEKRRKAEEAKRKRAERLKAIVVLWQSWLCSRQIAMHPHDVDLVLFAAATGACCLPNADDGDEIAFETFKPKRGRRTSMIGELIALDGEGLDNFCASSAERLFWSDDLVAKVQERWFYCDDQWQLDIAAWLKRLGIDPREEFRRKDAGGKQQFLGPLTEAWLAMADVRELAEEWKVPVLDKDSDPEIRRKLTANAARVMPLPAELAALLSAGKKSKVRKPK